jgi:hypothetical protein
MERSNALVRLVDDGDSARLVCPRTSVEVGILDLSCWSVIPVGSVMTAKISRMSLMIRVLCGHRRGIGERPDGRIKRSEVSCSLNENDRLKAKRNSVLL